MRTWIKVFTVLAVVVALIGVSAIADAASRAGRVYWTSRPALPGTVNAMVVGNGQIYVAGTATDNVGGPAFGAQFAVAAISPRNGMTIWRTPFFLRGGEAAAADSASSIALEPDGQRLFAAGWLNSALNGNAFAVFAIDPRTGQELWRYLEDNDPARGDSDQAFGVASAYSWALAQPTACAVGRVHAAGATNPQFSVRIFDAVLGPVLGFVAPFDVDGVVGAAAEQANAVVASTNLVAAFGALEEEYYVVGNRVVPPGTTLDAVVEAYFADGSGVNWTVTNDAFGVGAADELVAATYDPALGIVYAVGNFVEPIAGGVCTGTGGIAGSCRQAAIYAVDVTTGTVLWVDSFDLTSWLGWGGVLQDLDDRFLTVKSNGRFVVAGGFGTVYDPTTMTGPSREGILVVYDALLGAPPLSVTRVRASGAPPHLDQINSVALSGNNLAFGGFTTSPVNNTTFLTGYGQLNPTTGALTVRWKSDFNPVAGNVADQVNSVVFSGSQVVGGGAAGANLFIQSRFSR